ncbi:hypothetical protein GGX14DRAFT_408759 [Mycena pura]|uniref:Uncharacterized protein n=1 Tax=Mycena pura TaxID=153505 RepID=A0AAD6Y333_9AGAR|nr:hypothetical protein GGX14DRAFT_408759 [Mycena pura]
MYCEYKRVEEGSGTDIERSIRVEYRRSRCTLPRRPPPTLCGRRKGEGSVQEHPTPSAEDAAAKGKMKRGGDRFEDCAVDGHRKCQNWRAQPLPEGDRETPFFVAMDALTPKSWGPKHTNLNPIPSLTTQMNGYKRNDFAHSATRVFAGYLWRRRTMEDSKDGEEVRSPLVPRRSTFRLLYTAICGAGAAAHRVEADLESTNRS